MTHKNIRQAGSFHGLCGVLLTLILAGCGGGSTWTGQPAAPREASSAPSQLGTGGMGVQTPLPAAPVYQAAPYTPPSTPAQQPARPSPGEMLAFKALPPVKVGILLPLSGPHKEIGQAMLQAAQLALFDMGYERFELMPRDTGGTPQEAAAAASSAIEEGAQLLLGPLFADATRAVQSVAARRDINVISFSTDWSLAGGNIYVMGFMPFGQVSRIAHYAAARGYRNVGLLIPQDSYGDVVNRSFDAEAAKAGLAITQRLRVPAGKADLTPELNAFTQYEIRKANPSTPLPFQAVFMPLGGDQAAVAGNGLSFFGMPPQTVKRLGTGLWDDPALAREPGLEGAWFAAPSPAGRHDFDASYSRTYGKSAPRLASLAYDATALAAVLAQIGYKNGNRPAFNRTALTNPNGFAGIDGIFRFRPDGLVERGLAVLEIRGGRAVEIDPAPRTFQNLGY